MVPLINLAVSVDIVADSVDLSADVVGKHVGSAVAVAVRFNPNQFFLVVDSPRVHVAILIEVLLVEHERAIFVVSPHIDQAVKVQIELFPSKGAIGVVVEKSVEAAIEVEVRLFARNVFARATGSIETDNVRPVVVVEVDLLLSFARAITTIAVDFQGLHLTLVAPVHPRMGIFRALRLA